MSRPKSEASSQKTTKEKSGGRTKKATPQKATAKARSGQAASSNQSAQRRVEPAPSPAMPAEPRTPLLDYETRQQIAGVVVAVIGAALFIAMLAPTTGMLTQGLSAFLHTLFGVGAILVPLALVAWSVTIFTQHAGLVASRVIVGLLLVALAVMAGFGITTAGCTADANILFSVENLRARGGYVGNCLAWVLLSLFGQIAGFVVIVGIAIAGLVIIGLDVSSAVTQVRMRHQQSLARSAERRASRERRSSRYEDDFYEDELPEGYTPTVLFNPDDRCRPQSGMTAAPTSRVRSATTVIPFDHEAVDLRDYATPPASVLSRAKAAGVASTTLLDGEDDLGYEQVQPAPKTTLLAQERDDAGYEDDDAYEPADDYRRVPEVRSMPEQRFALDESLPQPPQSLINKKARRASSGWWNPADEWNRDAFDPNDLGDGQADSLVPGVIPGAPLYYDDSMASSDDMYIAEKGTIAPSTAAATAAAACAPRDDAPAAALPAEPMSDFEAAREAKRPSLPVTPMYTRPAQPAGESDSASLDNSTNAAVDAACRNDAYAQAVSGPAVFDEDCAECELPWEEPAKGASAAAVQPIAPVVAPAAPQQRRSAATSLNATSVFAQVPTRRASSDEAAEALVNFGASQQDTPVNEGPYELPPLALARRSNGGKGFVAEHSELAQETAAALQSALAEFGVDAHVVDWVEGPTFTTYRLCPGKGVRVNRISALENDIARTLAAPSVRIYSPVAGTSYVGVEVANESRREVAFGDVLPCVTGGPLDFAVGLDAGGKPVHADLGKLPHLLIAGTTGSGKSVTVNSIILSMLMRDTPEELRLIIVDPKQVEFSEYAGIPHLAMPVVTDPRQAAAALQWAVTEMDRRYRVFSNLGVRDLASYNSLVTRIAEEETNLTTLPCVVVVIDELADLMMVAKKDVEASIVRVAQLGRAAGIHLVIATQTPRADIVTGLIRANVANRIALRVSKGTDSRIIIDQMGAEKLLPHGDMLFLEASFGDMPRRIQGCNVTDEEKAAILNHIKSQPAARPCAMAPMPSAGGQLPLDTSTEPAGPTGRGGSAGPGDDDPLAWEAAKLVVENQLGSTSMLQRRMKLGYARAGRVMDLLEEMGVVGPAQGSKPRTVLVSDLDELETLRNADIPSGE